MWRCTWILGLLAACAAPPGPAPLHQPSATLRACADAGGRVTSISRAVEVLNALPTPVDGPCFVAALPRPLKVVAANSVVSAQPASSRESPRLFLFLDGVVATVVPEGDGATVLEFSQWTSATRSIKAGLPLPMASMVASDAPYTHVRRGPIGTTCGLCHTAEQEESPGVYASTAYRPHARDEVPVSELRARHEACGHDVDGGRAMFHAVFDFGEVQQGAFDTSLETFGP